jgi:hypothetical protein
VEEMSARRVRFDSLYSTENSKENGVNTKELETLDEHCAMLERGLASQHEIASFKKLLARFDFLKIEKKKKN